MNLCAHAVLMADYNRWMNEKVCTAAAQLAPDALTADRGAFFGSILGTLNHLMVADLIWLRRFALHPRRPPELGPEWPVPATLNAVLYADLAALAPRRAALDESLQRWVGSLSEADLDHVLDYRSTQGVPARKRFGSLLMHLFNHQTHHRGQVTTLLTQAGVDVGVTDLLPRIANEAAP